jgi:nucleoside 2-deoxyribosyltransferase
METHTYPNDTLKVFRYEDSEESVTNVEGPTVFLAGPTVRGNQPHLTSWRFEAIELFKEKKFVGSLFVPEFTDKTVSDKGKNWVPMWEFNGLKRADCILFWIPRTRELIGLTTNWEHGYWMGRALDKMVYGRPNDAFRIDYIDTMWNAIHSEIGKPGSIYDTLGGTISASIYNASGIH